MMKMKVNWATSSGNGPKQDTSSKSNNFDICLISVACCCFYGTLYPLFLPPDIFEGKKKEQVVWLGC